MLLRFSILSIDMLCDYVMLQPSIFLLVLLVCLIHCMLSSYQNCSLHNEDGIKKFLWQARGLADLVVATATAMRRIFDAMEQNLAIATS